MIFTIGDSARKPGAFGMFAETRTASPVQGEVASGVSRKPDDGGVVAWNVAEACPQPLSQPYG